MKCVYFACLHTVHYHNGTPPLPRVTNHGLLAAEHGARPNMYSNAQGDAHIDFAFLQGVAVHSHRTV